MKRILASSLMAGLALAGRAGAGDRCDLDGVPGAEVVVRYPRPHPAGEETDRHDNKHTIFKMDPTSMATGSTLGYYDPRIIAIGNFTGDTDGCELLWEERDPVDPHHAPEHTPIRVAITDGFLQANSLHFAIGTPRPPLPWDVAGAFDVTGDGRTDVLWWNPQTGAVKLWARNHHGWRESDVQGALAVADPTGARPRFPYTAIARFEPEQAPGIVWKDPMHDAVLYYKTKWNGEHLSLSEPHPIEGLPPGLHSIAAVADFDGDGQDDLMERRTSDDSILICLMNGLVSDTPCYVKPPDTFGNSNDPLGWFVVGPR